MIDNFSLIEPLLSFQKDEFYFIQIIKRRKDNPEMEKSVSIKDRFIISSIEDFQKLKDKIINRCYEYNARAYININPRDHKKTAFETLKLIAEACSNEQYHLAQKAYFSACGKYCSRKIFWFIDLDEKDSNKKEEVLQEVNPWYIAEIPSKTGCHIIVDPFDPREFYKKFSNVQLEKDGATNLYIP